MAMVSARQDELGVGERQRDGMFGIAVGRQHTVAFGRHTCAVDRLFEPFDGFLPTLTLAFHFGG